MNGNPRGKRRAIFVADRYDQMENTEPCRALEEAGFEREAETSRMPARSLSRMAIGLCLLTLLGCRQEPRENDPLVEVNRVRPKEVVEMTNEIGIPLTNLPRISTNKQPVQLRK
jgi:hypothetical protein